MKKPKKRMIFSTEGRTFEDSKAWLIERHLEENPEDKDWAPSDTEVFDEMQFETDHDWEDQEYELKKHLADFDKFLVLGSCGTWQGPRSGGKFCNGLHEIMQCISACDIYELYDRNGRLCIEGDHHDGHNSFEVKALTRKGFELAQRECFENYHSLHEKLWNSNLYTKDLHFAHEVWGSPKRQYESTKKEKT